MLCENINISYIYLGIKMKLKDKLSHLYLKHYILFVSLSLFELTIFCFNLKCFKSK